MDPEEIRKKLELDILQVIEQKLTSGEMNVERAQAIARMVLDRLHPPLSLEQIYTVAPTLDDEFAELATAVLPVLEMHEDEVKRVVSEHAQNLIKSGKFEEARELLKKTNQDDTA